MLEPRELHSFGLMSTKFVRPLRELPISPHHAALRTTPLPEAFDSRVAWPGCIGPIRNQGQCGSCWAFGAVESLADRTCIASGGSVNITLSAESLLQCDTADEGCNGGYLDNAWEGLVSRGALEESCDPYTHCDYPPAPLPTPISPPPLPSDPRRAGMGVS